MILNLSWSDTDYYTDTITSSINDSRWQPTLVVAVFCENTILANKVATVFSATVLTLKLSYMNRFKIDYKRMLQNAASQHKNVLIVDAKNHTFSRFSAILSLIDGKTMSLIECNDTDHKADYVGIRTNCMCCHVFPWLK